MYDIVSRTENECDEVGIERCACDGKGCKGYALHARFSDVM